MTRRIERLEQLGLQLGSLEFAGRKHCEMPFGHPAQERKKISSRKSLDGFLDLSDAWHVRRIVALRPGCKRTGNRFPVATSQRNIRKDTRLRVIALRMRTPALLLAFVASVSLVTAAPEAFEFGPEQKAALPGGREADGIIGDFILRNDRIEAVVSGNLPLRRANMSTFYGESGSPLASRMVSCTARSCAGVNSSAFSPRITFARSSKSPS